MKTLVGFLIAMSCLLLVRSLVSGHPAVVPAGQANGPALLAIPTDIAAATGYSVTVPVAFQSSGNAVGSSTFSLDFDESCLAFDATDGNNDGRPDSVRFTTPLAFRSSVSYNGADLDGELDVVIADYSLPIASLPDLPELMTVRFTAFCAPAAGEPIMAPVRFSTAPVASFGDVNGLDVESSVSDGAVVIYETLPSTPTPTITPTTAPVTPSVTPTPGTPTPAPGTPTPTVMPTVTASPATPVPTAPASNWLYLPVINQAGP